MRKSQTNHAVVSGASIAGLSAAFWLRKTGWEVTVLERAPAFRDGGQNVDVRGKARDILRRMGLFDQVKAQNTTEIGTVLVGPSGEVLKELSSGGTEGATAELEVLRGDFARVLLENLPDGVRFVYGERIAEVADGSDTITMTTTSGLTLPADLLVIAEGVRSSTRDLVFQAGTTLDKLGINMVFGTIARTADDDRRWRWYTATQGRQVHLRPDNHGTTRAVLAYTGEDDLRGLDKEELLAKLGERFLDAGWQAPRVLEGFMHSEDIYADHLTYIKMEHWHQGRTVMAGDAGWCVTPIGGRGASLALVSGYALAECLAKYPDNLEAALGAYEQWMRPLVDEVQRLPPGFKQQAFPE